MIEPVNPGQGPRFEIFDGTELPVVFDALVLVLVQTGDGIGQGVIETVPDGTDRRDRTSSGKPIGVAECDVLTARVAVLYQSFATTLIVGDTFAWSSK